MIPKIPHNFYHRVFFPLLELYQIVIFILSYFLQRQLAPETNLHIFPLLQFLHLYHFVWVAQFWRYWQYNETNWHLPCGARSAKKINKYISLVAMSISREKKRLLVLLTVPHNVSQKSEQFLVETIFSSAQPHSPKVSLQKEASICLVKTSSCSCQCDRMYRLIASLHIWAVKLCNGAACM